MKENLVFCKAQKVHVDKSEHCPAEKCDHCSRYPIVIPSIPKKQTPKKQKQKQAAIKPEPETEEVPPKAVADYSLLPPRLHEEIRPDVEIKHIPTLDILAMHCRKSQFENEGNPVYPIEAFMLAYQNGLYPPVWVMDFMYKAFEGWHTSNGRKSLDEWFGLKPDVGQTPVFKKLLTEDWYEILLFDVLKLRLFFGYTVDKACAMVRDKLEESKDYDKTKWGLTMPNEGTIRNEFFKWKKKSGAADIKDRENRILSKYTKEMKTKFLNTFPKIL